jgi:hypothetical protein
MSKAKTAQELTQSWRITASQVDRDAVKRENAGTLARVLTMRSSVLRQCADELDALTAKREAARG